MARGARGDIPGHSLGQIVFFSERSLKGDFDDPPRAAARSVVRAARGPQTHGTANRQPTTENGPKRWWTAATGRGGQPAAFRIKNKETKAVHCCAARRNRAAGCQPEQAAAGDRRARSYRTRSDQTSPNMREAGQLKGCTIARLPSTALQHGDSLRRHKRTARTARSPWYRHVRIAHPATSSRTTKERNL